MTPEYLEDLADRADPDQLWRLAGLDQIDLPVDKRRQLDAGVALRRYASHVRRLNDMLGSGNSLLITPLSKNSTATKQVPTPEDHAKFVAASPVPAVQPHGHVVPRPDGVKARCGGPAICRVCQTEQATLKAQRNA